MIRHQAPLPVSNTHKLCNTHAHRTKIIISLDPFDFNNDSRVPDFNSFMEEFHLDDEDQFRGFMQEEVYFSSASRVRGFHQRLAVQAEKENIPPPARPPAKKRKADPSW